MNISIDVPMLIAKAKQESGLTFGQMAEEMHRSRTRISEWLSAKAEPTSDDIAYLADKARLPIIDTVVALRPEWAHVWRKAVSQARQNQG